MFTTPAAPVEVKTPALLMRALSPRRSRCDWTTGLGTVSQMPSFGPCIGGCSHRTVILAASQARRQSVSTSNIGNTTTIQSLSGDSSLHPLRRQPRVLHHDGGRQPFSAKAIVCHNAVSCPAIRSITTRGIGVVLRQHPNQQCTRTVHLGTVDLIPDGIINIIGYQSLSTAPSPSMSTPNSN